MGKILLSVFILWGSGVLAQEITVTGKVSDSEDIPLPGATVLIMDTDSGTQTDFDGNFTLTNVPAEAVLQVSYIGYATQEVSVDGRTNIIISLSEDVQALDDVVVIGYGQLRVKDLTSSISTVQSEDIVKTPTAQVMQALQGKVPGLQIVSNGAPGNAPAVRIRGLGSYDAANTGPLYVVDGMFFNDIDFLNTTDIETVSVLKDASAAAIYGVRAANGVVLIETKSGQYNKKAEITYDTYTGYQIAQNILKMANTEQFTTMAIESGSAADVSFIENAMQRYGRSRINPNVPNVNTDWYNEVMRPATIMNHSFGVSGGGESAAYKLGASFFEQDGILDMKNEYRRFNLNSKIDYKANDWLTVGANTIFSNATKYESDDAAWFQTYFAVPVLPVYDEITGNYANAQDLGYRGGQNPFATLDYNENKLKIRKVLTNFYAQFNLVPDLLTFKTTYNHAYTSIEGRYVDLPFFIGDGFQRPDSQLEKTAETYSNQIWDNVLTYNQVFGKHDLTVMAGTSFRDESYHFLASKGVNFPWENEKLWYLDLADDIIADNTDDRVGDDGRREYGFSYFGRVSYNFDNKYLLYGTMRADGTSKYQEKYGYFPSIGVGWVLSEEEFMQNNGPMDFLKLRASWGQLGNDKIPASNGSNSIGLITTSIGDELVTGLVSSSTFDFLGWEVVEEWNVGLSSRLFSNRLSLELDYFQRDTKNAVIPVVVPMTGETRRKNSGEIRNSGLEVAVNWYNEVSDDFSYTVGANFSTLENEVLDLFGQPYLDGGSAEFRQRSIVGEPLLAFYGYEVQGVYQNDAQIQADPVAFSNGLMPGDLIFKDQNGDGNMDGEDRVVLGSYLPSYTYGGNFGINYKSWEFTASFMGQIGNKILNRKRGEMIFTTDTNMDADLAINRWHGEGTSNEYPSSSGLRRSWNQSMSDYFVEDGSFFRLQNVQLAYTLSGKKLSGTVLPDTRIYLTAERPLTIFKYNGFNPEVVDGVDRQTYPIPAIYTLGLNFRF